MITYFKNKKRKQKSIELYHKMLYNLNVKYEFVSIETSYGNTNIITCGNKEHPPLLMLHGLNSCAPIIMSQLKGLLLKYRVYAVDILGNPNLSDENRLDLKNNDYGKWFYEITSRLNLFNTIIVGVSFGAWVSLKSLALDNKRISKAYLINPMGIIENNLIKKMLKEWIPLTLFKLTKNEKFAQNWLNKNNVVANTFLLKTYYYYNIDKRFIPSLTNQETEKIDKPITIIITKDSQGYSSSDLVDKVKKLFTKIDIHIETDNTGVLSYKKEKLNIENLIINTKLR